MTSEKRLLKKAGGTWLSFPLISFGLILALGGFQTIGILLADPNSNEGAYCLGYISGLADAMKEGNSVNKFKACIPDSASDMDILKLVRKVLKDNPNNLHYTGSDLVAYAYQEAYPCK